MKHFLETQKLKTIMIQAQQYNFNAQPEPVRPRQKYREVPQPGTRHL